MNAYKCDSCGSITKRGLNSIIFGSSAAKFLRFCDITIRVDLALW